MKRNVIEINEEKCVGCGLCAGACMQGAIQIIDGKAKLTSDSYCDGLGMCLPKCPVDAIHLVEKETDAFDQTRKNIKNKDAAADSGCGCPGSQAKTFTRNSVALELTPTKEREKKEAIPVELSVPSELMQWPVPVSYTHLTLPTKRIV